MYGGSRWYREDLVFFSLAETCEGDKDLELVLVACRPRTE